MEAQELSLFAGTFAISAALPGSDTLLLFSRTLVGGRTSALPLAAGITLGKVCLLAAAALGVTTVFASHDVAFTTLRYGGALYIMYIALQTWRRANHSTSIETRLATPGSRMQAPLGAGGLTRGIFAGAALTMGNPQALAFYIAVLPGVIGNEPLSVGEVVSLEVILVIVMVMVVTAYVVAASGLRHGLNEQRLRRFEQGGAVMLFLVAIGLCLV